jgi:glycosyltransferase involved in cell wall biosynthesis
MPDPAPGRVSVIIPARNEESNIARVVRSVASQEGVREILVVDDQSSDATAAILESLRREFPALRVMQTETLPDGWTGKAHALALGAREASSDWLLFTDADTEHRPGSLKALLERAERAGADLLSLSPGQRVLAWWEKSVIPQVYVRLAKLYRFEDVSDPKSPAAAANGQYLLIRRDAYQRAGGHEAVRTEILEDVELARRVKAAGGRLIFLAGAEWVETRMYSSFRAMWQGWTKNLYLLYGGKLGRIFAALAEVILLDVALPIAFLALCLVMVFARANAALALATVVLFFAVVWRQWRYGSALQRLGFDLRLAPYGIPGAGLFALLLVNSVLAHRVRGSVGWKGRDYSTRV